MRSHSPTASPRAPAERAPRLRPLGVGVGLFLLALFLVAGFKTWRDLAVVERREVELEAAITRAHGDIGELEGRLERLRDDPAVLERLAREELTMTYPDELTVILPSETPPDCSGRKPTHFHPRIIEAGPTGETDRGRAEGDGGAAVVAVAAPRALWHPRHARP
jgi:cell division protein FtsB